MHFAKQINVRLSRDALRKIDKVIDKGFFASNGHFVRRAIDKAYTELVQHKRGAW